MNNKLHRLISKSMLVVYVLSLLLSVMPVQIYAAGPKSSTSSSSKSSSKSSSNSYKSSGSSYKSSSSSSSKSYSSSSSKSSSSSSTSKASSSSSSSKSSSSKSSGGFFGKIASSVKSTVSKAAAKVTSTVKSTVSSAASKISTASKAVAQKVTTTAKKITNTVKTAASSAVKAVAKAAAPIKNAVAKVAAPVKQAVSNAAKKVASTVSAVKQKVASAVSNTAKNIKSIASNIGKTAKAVASSVVKKVGAAVQQVKTTVSNIKTNVAKLVKDTKTLVSKAQEKIKTTIKGYATYIGQKVKTGVSNLASKVKQTATSAWNKTKQTVSNIAKNPAVQRVAKGVGATLQIAGGIVQTAGGIALSSTGLGAVLGVPVAAHGAADIVQGGIKLFNAITGKSVPEVNFMQEAYKAVGKAIGGEKGAAIANNIFTVADIGLGLVSPTKLVGTFSKINNLGDLAKFVKAAPKNIIKNTIDTIPKVFKSVKTAGAKVLKTASNLGNKLTTTATKTYKAIKGVPAKAANILSNTKKFTAGFKTTLGNVGQAMKAGVKGYSAATYKLGITPKSPLVEGIEAGVKKFKELSKGTRKVDDGVRYAYDESIKRFRDVTTGRFVSTKTVGGELATKSNEAFFWSGRTNGVGGALNARTIAESRGGVTLEKLLEVKGIKMPAWDETDSVATKIWKNVSGEYADQVSGRVRGIIGESLRADAVWTNDELPKLLNNKKVTEIILIDPATQAEKVLLKR